MANLGPVYAGTDVTLRHTVTDAAGAAVDLAGRTLTLRLFPRGNTQASVTEAAIPTATTGEGEVTLTDLSLASGVYDYRWYFEDGAEDYVTESGTLTVLPAFTTAS